MKSGILSSRCFSNKFGVFDIENDKDGNIVLIGYMDERGYTFFLTAKDFFWFLCSMRGEKRQMWAHNLEYDFFKLYQEYPFFEFEAHYSAHSLVYVRVGSIYFKDTMNHIPGSLRSIGEEVGLMKGEYDFNHMKMGKELVQYNRRDCEIVYLVCRKLMDVYSREGCRSIKSTSGGQALDIFNRSFFGGRYKKMDDDHLLKWRQGFKGGYTEALRKGRFDGEKFWKIDVNSLYPKIMLQSYPDPNNYVIGSKGMSKWWLGVVNDFKYESSVKVMNSVENQGEKRFCDYFFNFGKSCYPFKQYVLHFNSLKESSTDSFDRTVYKRLMNALYGKFAQRRDVKIITNKKMKIKDLNINSTIRYTDKIYQYEYTRTGFQYYVNMVWSIFTTARARKYIQAMIRYIERRGLKVYYVDTDGLIISGDIERIRSIIDSHKIGLFKVQSEADSIEIKGKKLYRFGDEYICKGVPKKYAKDYFEKGEVVYAGMIKLRTALLSGVKIGANRKVVKGNIANV